MRPVTNHTYAGAWGPLSTALAIAILASPAEAQRAGRSPCVGTPEVTAVTAAFARRGTLASWSAEAADRTVDQNDERTRPPIAPRRAERTP